MKFRPRHSVIVLVCLSVFLVSCGRQPADSDVGLRKGIRPAAASIVDRIRQTPSEPVKVITMPAETVQGKGIKQTEPLRQVKTNRKLVALTFDDGPDNLYTPRILDILKQEQVKATFYVIGLQTKKYPQVVKRINAEGHAVGIHTWSHVNLNRVSTNEAQWQVKYCATQLGGILGYTPNTFRPPFGSINSNVLGLLNRDGFWGVTWSVDTRDWNGKPVKTMLATVRQEMKPGGIILMHSAGSHSAYLNNSVALLPQLITDLKKQGYTFVTVPELYKESLAKKP